MKKDSRSEGHLVSLASQMVLSWPFARNIHKLPPCKSHQKGSLKLPKTPIFLLT